MFRSDFSERLLLKKYSFFVGKNIVVRIPTMYINNQKCIPHESLNFKNRIKHVNHVEV